MEVILLERIARLGQMGDVVRVRDGYARNFLLPQGKALRANDANRVRFDREKVQLEARNLEARKEAEAVAGKLSGQSFVVIRQAGETGQLYGSVATRDIAEIADAAGFTIERRQVRLDRAIKTIGLHEVMITLHPEVEVPITVNVARSSDEAERQARGEDLTRPDALLDAEAAAEAAEEAAAEAGRGRGGRRSGRHRRRAGRRDDRRLSRRRARPLRKGRRFGRPFPFADRATRCRRAERRSAGSLPGTARRTPHFHHGRGPPMSPHATPARPDSVVAQRGKRYLNTAKQSRFSSRRQE